MKGFLKGLEKFSIKNVRQASHMPKKIFELYFPTLLLVVFFFYPSLSNSAPIRGVAGDLWADIILGQPGFGDIAPNQVGPKGLFNPYSSVVDTLHNILYVYDSGNNRILGVSNLPGLTSGQGADIVLGQTDFTHSSCNHDSSWLSYPAVPTPDASCLCGLRYDQQSPAEGGSVGNMVVDTQGNLYVPDYFNNRVVRYDWPIATNEAASHVWGQPNFNSYQFNNVGGNVSGTPNNSNLNFYPNGVGDNHYYAGVGTDNLGNLWVADASNNRVLRFPNPNVPGAGVPQSTADVVLGQSNFSSTVAASMGDLAHLKHPGAVRVDAAGNVYVSDLVTNAASAFGWSGRVLVYKPTGNDPSGQPKYGATNMGLSASAAITQFIDQANGLEWDPSGDLWVSQYYETVLFHFTLSPSVSAAATKVLMQASPIGPGQASGTTGGDGPNFIDNAGEQPSSALLAQDLRGSVGVDSSGNVYAPGGRWQDVLRFQAPQPAIGTLPAGQAHSANLQVFKPSQWRVMNNISSNGDMYVPSGVAIGGGQVIESNVNRLAFWNMPSGPSGLTNGQAADGFAGTTTPLLWLTNPFGRIREDQATPQHLWVIHNISSTIQIEPYLLPLHNGDMPMSGKTLTSPLPILGGGTLSWTAMEGLSVDPSANYLWLADKVGNRVFRVRNPLTSPMVDIILGQPNASSVGCNGSGSNLNGYSCGNCSQPTPSQSTLYVPGAVVLDHQGNLYVSDHGLECAGNQRMLRWNASTIAAASAGLGSAVTCGIPADAVYGTNGSFTASGCQTANGICGPWEPAFTANDGFMVTGLDSQQPGLRFPIILTNPLAGDTPSGNVLDFGPQSYGADFDTQDNFYITELNRNRILIYLQPFGTPGPTLTPTIMPTPTITLTFTPTGSYTYTTTMTPTKTNSPTITPTPGPNCCQAAVAWITPTLSGAAGVAVDMSRDRVYAPDRGTGALNAYTYTGSPVVSFGTNGTVTGLQAFCVAVGTCAYDGVYVVQRSTSGNVIKLDANGNVVWTSPSSLGGGANRSINVDSSGTIYVCTDGGSIYLLDNTGALKATLTGYGLSAPTGSLKLGSVLYVDDTANNRIVSLPQTGAYTYGLLSVAVTVTSPYVITSDLAGNYYVASSNNNSFYIYNSSWTLLSTCTNGVLLAGAFGIAVDETGAVYVAGQSSNTVAKMQLCYSQQAQPTCPPTITPTLAITPTPTATNTPTITATNTITNTRTNSPTLTLTFTLTSSPTVTFTPTLSWTPTITPTPTETNTPTITATNTITNTRTNSPTLTLTFTLTSSPTVTFTPTLSWTPTITPTPTATNTPAITATNTITNTRTNSPTLTLTFTLTSSPTVTFTPTLSWTPTITPTPTVTNTPTITLTPSGPDGIYPNPVRGGDTTYLQIHLDTSGDVRVQVWTVAYRKIAEWIYPSLPPRVNDLPLPVKDKWGTPLANGLYYLVINKSDGRTILKMIVLK